MKKLCVTFLALILCIFVFTSCQFKPESAADVMEKIDEKMESLKSYQSDMTAEMKTKIQEMDCEISFTGQQIVLEDYYYNLMEGSTVFKGGMMSDPTVKFKEIEAFHDGKMFIWKEQWDASETVNYLTMNMEDLSQKLCSSLTKEEFAEYLENQSDDLDIDYNECVNSAFVRNEDKTWTLTYSGYTKKTIDKVVQSFGDELFEEEIVDMEITIHANKDFTAKDIEIKMIFEESAISSSFRIYTQYSKYNEATAVTDTLNPSDYTEIADCRLLKGIENMLEDLEESDNGSFVLDMDQTLTIKKPSQTQKTSEKDTVHYGEKDGKYFYTVHASYDGADIDIAYENGKQTTTVNGISQIADQTEKEAKAFINGLINTASYESIRVSNITKIEDGVYKIDHRPDKNIYKPVFSALNATMPQDSQVKQTITITVRDGKIESIQSELQAACASDPYGSVTFTLNSTNTFDHSANDNAT